MIEYSCALHVAYRLQKMDANITETDVQLVLEAPDFASLESQILDGQYDEAIEKELFSRFEIPLDLLEVISVSASEE